jgi:hypothetical protein
VTSPAPASQPLTMSSDPRELRPAARLRDGRWLVRRALLCLGLILGFALATAALYDAAIDPTDAASQLSE